MFSTLKKALFHLRYTPFHPQWFVFRHEAFYRQQIAQTATGKVLDIGCADQTIKTYLSAETEYIGLDYYQTATQWYGTKPHIYGDAQALPFADNSMDTVLLLDVMEHLPRPHACLQDIARVLKPKGKLILQVPFLYPIHDAPLDFQRWTQYGLQTAVKSLFTIRQQYHSGNPLETAGLLLNIAMTKIVVNGLAKKHPATLFGIFVPPTILLVNLLCWVIDHFTEADDMMPYGYYWVLEKKD